MSRDVSKVDEWRSLQSVVGQVLDGLTVRPVRAQSGAGGERNAQK